MKKIIVSFVLGALLFGSTGSLTSQAQSPAEQPPAKLIVAPPEPDLLAKGLVAIQYRTENVRILPVFGPAALAISPRIGHLHVTVDDAPLVWGNTSGEPVVINGLPPGPHKIGIALTDANHKILVQEVVKFEVPRGRPEACCNAGRTESHPGSREDHHRSPAAGPTSEWAPLSSLPHRESTDRAGIRP